MSKKIKKFPHADADARAITSIVIFAVLFGALGMFVLIEISPLFSPGFAARSYSEGHRAGARELEPGYRVIRLESQFLSDEAIRGIQAELETMKNEVSNCLSAETCNQ